MSGGSPYDYGRDYSAPPGQPQSRYRMWMLWAVVGALAVAAVVQWVLDPARDAAEPSGIPDLGAIDPDLLEGEPGYELLSPDEDADASWRDVTPEAHLDTGVPGGEPVRIRDWEITVLAASRDEVEVDWDDGPETHDEVSVKIALRNVGAEVGDTELIEWGFGSPTGTQHGFNPWDDWCTAVPEQFSDVPDIYDTRQVFPDEVIVGRTCVPVPAEDVVGLQLFPEIWDAHGSVETATLVLPPNGPDLTRAQGLTRPEAWRIAWGQAAHAGRVGSASVAVESVSPRAADTERTPGLTPWEIVLTTVDGDPSGTVPAPYEVHAYGPSGTEYPISYCELDDWKAASQVQPDEPFEHTYCADVTPEDEERLLLVAGGPWMEGPALVLRAEPSP